ncbi:MAG: MATE family efflux transporter [Ilumatobacter sp.]|uniref:MATE family efflux transporter n=1 Tax=Ilumatobacter sp. TaxID=1967498 RepID=UPI002625C5E9|nr:MATE family efflux transporter [Ilumatobacter sp.]MDJ0771256.1 MATE family efflux transporter [Ilumatobacter sp.]
MTSRRSDRFTPVDRRILGLALPALGSLAVEPVYVLVDTAIVGRLGTEELAGLAIAATVLSFVFAGANFLTYGTTERVARRLGAGADTAAADVGVQALWLALLFGVPAAPLLFFGSRTLSRLLGATGEVLDHAETYLSISALGVPFFLITLAAQGVLRGASDYLTPLWVLLAANVTNLVVELVLVFGLDMGVAGSAWSTVIAQIGASLVFLRILWRRVLAAAIRRPDRRGMAPLMTAGRHLLLRVGSMLAVFAGSTAVAARIDEPTLAAHQVVISFFFFLALTLDALAVPAQTIVAEELGRGDRAGAAHVASRAVRLSVGTGLLLGAFVATLAPVLPNIFTDDPEVVSRATSGIWWLSALLLPGAVAFAHDGVLIGAADYRFLGRAAFGYLIVVTPLAVVTLLFPELGVAGIWGGLLVWMVVRAVVNDRRTRTVLA